MGNDRVTATRRTLLRRRCDLGDRFNSVRRGAHLGNLERIGRAPLRRLLENCRSRAFFDSLLRVAVKQNISVPLTRRPSLIVAHRRSVG